MDSGHRFSELADSAPVLIWRAGPDKQFDYFNSTWLSFRGRTLDQEVGYGWLEGVHPDDVERCMAVYVTAFDNRQDFTIDYRLRRYDGEYRWMVDTGRPYTRSDGTFGGFLGSCLDITERKQAEVRAARALADARRAIRQRDVLLAEVHHRVKNNLQVILSLLTLQARQVDDAAGRAAIEAVGRRIQALAIVQQELHEDPDVSMIGMLDYVNRLVRPLCALYRSDHVTTHIDGHNVPIGLTMASIVGMMTAEILGNAFQHGIGVEGGTLTITSMSTNDAGPILTITDSGPGVASEETGTGLGLLLIRSLARQGGIKATLSPGRGARWELRLPRSALAADEAA